MIHSKEDDEEEEKLRPLITKNVIAAEEPRQRIDSRALLDWCNGKINRLRQAVGSTDAELYAWAAANMSAPPEPTNQTPMPDFDPHDPSDKQVSCALPQGLEESFSKWFLTIRT